MKKQYNFWLDDQPQFSFDNPLSSCDESLAAYAMKHAEYLLKVWHPKATWCKFKAVNGKKEYTLYRVVLDTEQHLDTNYFA